MLQIDFLEELLKKCKAMEVSTAVDTAGNIPWEYFQRILPYTDLFLYETLNGLRGKGSQTVFVI